VKAHSAWPRYLVFRAAAKSKPRASVAVQRCHGVQGEPTADGGTTNRIGRTAANALELTVTEAISFGHNYIGCEHLLLGLLGGHGGDH
jgi:hypothetical protein